MADKKEARKQRVPLGVPRLKMSVTERDGFQRRWINDTGGRLAQAEEGGYCFVKREGAEFKEADAKNQNSGVNNCISKVVNSDGTRSYLMEIPMAMYESDQLAKMAKIDELENGLRVGDDAHGKTGRDGRYVPREGIKID